jgi:hypothetical protein
VILGYGLTFFVLLVIMAIIIILVSNEKLTPKGLSDYKCYGFFPSCDTPICIDVSENVTTGSYDSLPGLSNWRHCTLESTSKLQATACIYDSSLYSLTGGNLGYDVCKDEFAGGAYVFEDTFENWVSPRNFETNLMKSANWNSSINVETNNYCGVPKSNGGNKALVFSGDFFRYVVTDDVDVVFGGWLEAQLFLAPVGYDVSNPK